MIVIIFISFNLFNVFVSQVSTIKLPYDFISILEIESATENSTYTCKAANAVGQDAKDVNIIVIRKEYFNILEVPKGKQLLNLLFNIDKNCVASNHIKVYSTNFKMISTHTKACKYCRDVKTIGFILY
jgi:hypothetical protein